MADIVEIDNYINADNYEYQGEQEKFTGYPREIDIGNLRKRTFLLLFFTLKKCLSSLCDKMMESKDA